jgi:hypothetical protein
MIHTCESSLSCITAHDPSVERSNKNTTLKRSDNNQSGCKTSMQQNALPDVRQYTEENRQDTRQNDGWSEIFNPRHQQVSHKTTYIPGLLYLP